MMGKPSKTLTKCLILIIRNSDLQELANLRYAAEAVRTSAATS